ncbi:hypothetical protein OG407_28910 [Streptomyces sp. NBC_01515]|uniref:hypothetical protein n=1 Tax=Streptomyces sp. NBC_01515 TaxID=2903890 RepID=UPI0038640986
MGGHVLVVIGAGGVGEAVARRLGRGRTVLFADIGEQTLKRAGTVLTGEDLTVVTRVVDVTSADSVREPAGAAREAGEVTRVVHTAGLSPVQASVEAIVGDLGGAVTNHGP